MASSSALVIPLSLLFIGTRIWALGRRHGFMTPVQMFRDRWECGHIGTVIFAVQALLLIPYIIIGVMGGGTTLATLSGGLVPVLGGRRRGRAGRHELRVLWRHARHGLGEHAADADVPRLRPDRAGRHRRRHGRLCADRARPAGSPATAPLLTRERVSPWLFFSYTFIPLSSIAFPHIGIFCLTARKLSHFKRTVLLYPVCMVADLAAVRVPRASPPTAPPRYRPSRPSSRRAPSSPLAAPRSLRPSAIACAARPRATT